MGEVDSLTARDSSGVGNTGKYNGNPTQFVPGAISGDSDRAVSLDGSSAYVSTSIQYANPVTFSEEAWFNTTSSQGGGMISFEATQTGTSGQFDRTIFMTRGGQLAFGIWTGSAQTVRSTGSYNDGVWHHVVAEHASNSLVLYVDGRLVGSKRDVGNAQSYNGFWRVGVSNFAFWNEDLPDPAFFNGTVDEVAIYPSALTQAQVSAHFAAAGPHSVRSDQISVVGHLSNASDSGAAVFDPTNGFGYYLGGFPGGVESYQVVPQPAPRATPIEVSFPLSGVAAVWDPSAQVAYTFGGFHGTKWYSDIVKFDPNGTIATVANLPNKWAGTSAVWDGAGNAYIFGGFNCSDGCRYSNQIYKFTAATGKAVPVKATLPTARSTTSAVWANGGAYIFGGFSDPSSQTYPAHGTRSYADILFYDPVKDTITQVGFLPSSRGETSAVAGPNGEIYIFGGDDASLTIFDDVLVFNVNTNQVTYSNVRLPSPRASTSAFWAASAGYIFGGLQTGPDTDEILRFVPQGAP